MQTKLLDNSKETLSPYNHSLEMYKTYMYNKLDDYIEEYKLIEIMIKYVL